MTIEKYSCFEYSVLNNVQDDCYYYEIYTTDPVYIEWMKTKLLRVSQECFETEQQARFAAIGHINLLENGGG